MHPDPEVKFPGSSVSFIFLNVDRIVLKHEKFEGMMMSRVLICIIFFYLNAIHVLAQDGGMIYGKVTTFDDEVYIGHLRWGSEETFWTDHFNASKLDTRVFGHLIGQKKDEEGEEEGWLGIDWSLTSIWEDRYGSVHEFVCEFGNIFYIEYIESRRILLRLKNGAVIKVGGSGYNDVRASVRMYDNEIGKIKIDGRRIWKVEFTNTPDRLEMKSGNPIYGSVITTQGDSIVGFIQWDHDERLDTEVLDGDSRGDDMSIPFKNISRIEARRNSSLVTLNSGREFLLSGTNDVNHENDGIIVTVKGLGRIDIPWAQVEHVNFLHNIGHSGPIYSEFKKPNGLRGKVTSIEGSEYEGYIVYDMDEVWEFEMLDGYSKGLNFKIPFANIKSITPKNYNYSWVELKSGQRLLLGDSRDVSDKNDGLIIFEEKNAEPIKIRWSRIDQITFD